MEATTPIRGIESRLRVTEGRVAAANGLHIRERWVDVASPPVRVRVLESGSGDPVMFINGISAPGIGMAPLAGRLPGHRHLLIDLPGHGLSPPYHWQGAPLREQAVNVIAGVVDGLDIDQVTLVGELARRTVLTVVRARPAVACRSGRDRRPTRGRDPGLARQPHDGRAHSACPRPGRDVDSAAARAPILFPLGLAGRIRRSRSATGVERHR